MPTIKGQPEALENLDSKTLLLSAAWATFVVRLFTSSP